MENEMKKVNYCQCCAMPMTEDAQFGTNADGSKNEEYCCYCMKDGKVTDCTLPAMIDVCAGIMAENGTCASLEDAKAFCGKLLPTLKHWRKGEIVPEVVEFPETRVAGISGVTSNNSPEMFAIIGKLWGDFYGKGIYRQLQGDKAAFAYGIYSDYVNGSADKYKITVAAPYNGELPEGVEAMVLPAGKYMRYFVEVKDTMSIGAAWAMIAEQKLDRTFVADFEEYLSDTSIYIYIGIK